MPIPSPKELLDAACHFGHRKEKWNPKMKPDLFGIRRGVHIFDLERTHKALTSAVTELKALQKSGKTILFVSTKLQALNGIERLSKALGQPVVTKKWVPGLLTNWSTIKNRIKYYLDLQQSFRTGDVDKYTKKEQVALRKELAKLEASFSGVAAMKGLPDAIFIVDAVRDHVAVLEARKLGIPVFGMCDSNADPDNFKIHIPANDDAVKSIEIILTCIENELSDAKMTDKDVVSKK